MAPEKGNGAGEGFGAKPYEERLRGFVVEGTAQPGEEAARGEPHRSLRLPDRRVEPGGDRPLLPDNLAAGQSLKLCQGISSQKVTGRWNGLPWEVAELLSLEVRKERLHVALSAMAWLTRWR